MSLAPESRLIAKYFGTFKKAASTASAPARSAVRPARSAKPAALAPEPVRANKAFFPSAMRMLFV